MHKAGGENVVPGRELALLAAPDAADAREDSLDARVRMLEHAGAAASRGFDSFQRAQTLLLSAMLVVLAGFVAVSIMFDLAVSREVRAVGTRVDVASQARATDQAALDARLDHLVQATSRSGRTTQAQLAPAYALPPLRPHGHPAK